METTPAPPLLPLPDILSKSPLRRSAASNNSSSSLSPTDERERDSRSSLAAHPVWDRHDFLRNGRPHNGGGDEYSDFVGTNVDPWARIAPRELFGDRADGRRGGATNGVEERRMAGQRWVRPAVEGWGSGEGVVVSPRSLREKGVRGTPLSRRGAGPRGLGGVAAAQPGAASPPGVVPMNKTPARRRINSAPTVGECTPGVEEHSSGSSHNERSCSSGTVEGSSSPAANGLGFVLLPITNMRVGSVDSRDNFLESRTRSGCLGRVFSVVF